MRRLAVRRLTANNCAGQGGGVADGDWMVTGFLMGDWMIGQRWLAVDIIIIDWMGFLD